MSEKDFYQMIAGELKLQAIQVAKTVELLDDGNTVPFIARYRKEATGKLDEVEIRAIEERIKYLRMLEERKATILKSIDEQGQLTPQLKAKIKGSKKLQELEDLYLPYRPKKRTRATIAREKGLEPLAELMLKQEITSGDPWEYARQYVDPEKEVEDVPAALSGARDIVAEVISDDAQVRKTIRERTRKTALIVSKAKDPEQKSDFEMYYDFSEPVNKIVPHRILAINRGEREKFLKVTLEEDQEAMYQNIRRFYITNSNSVFNGEMEQALTDSYKRLIAPSINREIRNELTENAERHAMGIFAANLKNLLLQSPVKNRMIMGIDPAYRTGCKIAVIDETGKYLQGETIYPHPPQNRVMEAKSLLRSWIDKYDIDVVAIGNGTASRETETMVAELIKEVKTDNPDKDLAYIIVNEAGASVYSASKIAQMEFPELEASQRGNISIARRLLDPLAELVKIDPKHIGVGMYQHDVNQKNLSGALLNVVESAVNSVGVDLNTASVSLLKYVSGLTARTAENIIKFREGKGKFINRDDLKEVPGIGDIAFQQAAGFLRIAGGNNPLDFTGIHPESYEATQKLLDLFKIKDDQPSWRSLKQSIRKNKINLKETAQKIDVGEPTLEDILSDLEKPGRDPRDEMPKPILKSDILKLEDLREGMILKGTIRNVVDFGAFIDIGLKRDGLVHVSQMANRFVKNPLEIVSVGDVVSVKVMSVDTERGRVQLSMKI